MSFLFNPLTGELDAVNPTWSVIPNNAGASSTTILDQINISNFIVAKYIVAIRDDTNNNTVSFELTVNNNNGTLKDSISSRLGSGINYAISADNNAGTMEINLINNETNIVTVNMARLTL